MNVKQEARSHLFSPQVAGFSPQGRQEARSDSAEWTGPGRSGGEHVKHRNRISLARMSLFPLGLDHRSGSREWRVHTWCLRSTRELPAKQGASQYSGL